MSDYLKRKIDDYLIKWKKTINHKPLIIKGARQVGKTKSILNFANSNYESIININFASEPVYKQITEDGYTPNMIIKNISRINTQAKFIKGNTLIYFDEIQEFPDIITTLKFFFQDGNYDIICSGYLLGTNYQQISNISVGYKTEIEMKSLDFEEFLWALGYDDIIKKDILEHMQTFTPFSANVLKLYNNLFFDYCLVGGMPEIVKDYLNNGTFENTLELQKQIILGYEQDIQKYANGINKNRIQNTLNSVPFQLAKENKKFQISKVNQNAKLNDYKNAIEWLLDSGIINISKALQTPNLPLKGNTIEDNFILYYTDTGLLLSQIDEEALIDFRQNKNINIYKGGLLENIISESLIKSGYDLCYYKKENSTLQEEFFVRYLDYLVPIDVKDTNNNSKSLSTLIRNPNFTEIQFGIKITKSNINYDSNIITFPPFCSFLIKEFLSTFKYK